MGSVLASLLVLFFPRRIVRDAVFHFSTANYLVFAVLTGLFPSIDFFKDEPQGDFYTNTRMTYGIGCGVIAIATVVKVILNRDAAIREDLDHDSEIEMADPEAGDKNSNPLLREQSPTLTSNPLWSLSEKKPDDGDDDND